MSDQLGVTTPAVASDKKQEASASPSDLKDPLASAAVADPLAAGTAPKVADGASGGGGKDGEKAASGGGDGGGLKNYEAALGSWLGPLLYNNLKEHLSLDNMTKYAEQGLNAGCPALGNALKDLDKKDGSPAPDQAVFDKFAQALLAVALPAGKDFVTKNNEAFNKWVDGNPGWVATIAILAAAGYLLSGPGFETRLGLGKGVSLSLKAKLGGIADLATNSIETAISSGANQFSLKASMERKDEEGKEADTYKGELGYTREGETTDADGKPKKFDKVKVKVAGETKLTGKKGENKELDSYKVDGSGAVALNDKGTQNLNAGVTISGKGKDTTQSASVGYSDSEAGIKAGVEGKREVKEAGETQSASATFSNSKSGTDVKASGSRTLDASGNETAQTVSGSVTQTLGKDNATKIEASASHEKKDGEADKTVVGAGASTSGKDVYIDEKGQKKEFERYKAGVSAEATSQGGDLRISKIKGDLAYTIDPRSNKTLALSAARTDDGKAKPNYSGSLTTTDGGVTQGVGVDVNGASNEVTLKNTAKVVDEKSKTSVALEESTSNKGKESRSLEVGKTDELAGVKGLSGSVKGSTGQDGEGGSSSSIGGKLGYKDDKSGKSAEASLDLEQILKREKVGDAYQLSDEQRLKLGLKLNLGDFEGSFAGKISSLGSFGASVDTKTSLGDNYDLLASGKVDYTKALEGSVDPSFWNVGASIGFKSKKDFQLYLAKYAYDSKADAHQFGLVVQETLGDFYISLDNSVRFAGKPAAGDSKFSAQGSNYVGYNVSKDFSVLGGASYKYGDSGLQVNPEVGFKIKDIPVTIGLDTGKFDSKKPMESLYINVTLFKASF